MKNRTPSCSAGRFFVSADSAAFVSDIPVYLSSLTCSAQTAAKAAARYFPFRLFSATCSLPIRSHCTSGMLDGQTYAQHPQSAQLWMPRLSAVSTFPALARCARRVGSSVSGHTRTQFPHLMHVYSASSRFDESVRHSSPLVALTVGTSSVYWLTPIIGPPIIT